MLGMADHKQSDYHFFTIILCALELQQTFITLLVKVKHLVLSFEHEVHNASVNSKCQHLPLGFAPTFNAGPGICTI